MARITGADKHSARLKRMAGPNVRREVFAALFAGGSMIEVEAEHSITAGSISGKGHVPSKPGEPPNADTRALDTQIETTGDIGRMRVEVASNDPKSRWLEEGTSKMAARPFMRPASIKKRGAVLQLVRKALDRATR